MHTPISNDLETPMTNGGVEKAKSQARQMGRRAAAAIDEKRGSVAGGIDSVASTVHRAADRLQGRLGGDRVVSAAHSAAGAMESAASYLREQDLQGMASDIRDVVRRHPGATLITAAAVGFLLARTFSRR